MNKQLLNFAPHVPFRINKLALCCGLLSLSVIASAQTQQQGDLPEAQSTEITEIERITVSADLSQRALSELPFTAFVLNAEAISARQARHVQDLIGMVPNLSFSSGASRGKFIQIRGIGESSQFDEPINPSIGLFIDDIDISGIGGLATLYDLQQVEVLSGPQSVAGGANSVGGIVKLLSNTPTDQTYANISLSYAQFNESQLAGTYSSALSSSVNSRISFQQTKSDGFVRNEFLDRDDTNGIDETSASILTTFELNQYSDLALNVYKFDINNGYDAFSLDNSATLSDEPGVDKLDALAGSLKYTHRFAQHTMQVTAYALQVQTEYGYDEDWTFVGIHPDGYSSVDTYYRDINRTGVDFKFASMPSAGNNSYLLGVNVTNNIEDLRRQNTFLSQDYVSNYAPTNISVFGQYAFAINDKMRLTSAARVERFSIDFEDQLGFTNISDTLIAASLSVDYELADSLVFASLSRGYKAGGFNIDDRLSTSNRTFAPEYNINYELGIKGSAYEGFANINLSFFYMDRIDAHVSDSLLFAIDDTGASSFADVIGNADSGVNKGVEFSSTWDIRDNWYLQANVGYLDAKFGNYTKADGEFVALQRQSDAPYFTGYFASTWQLSDSVSWFVDIDVKDAFRLGIDHEVYAPFTAVMNTELTWRASGKYLYSVKFWVKNITDRQIVTRGFGSFPNDPRDGYSTLGPYFQFGQVRQAGVTFTYEWE